MPAFQSDHTPPSDRVPAGVHVDRADDGTCVIRWVTDASDIEVRRFANVASAWEAVDQFDAP